MNYYERHIGDYIKKTAHLSLLEHGIYTRLLDVYYDREEPIPENKVARLVGAVTEAETQALQVVLQEFFQLQDGAWANSRCDEEIAAYVEGEPEREVKKANEGNRLKRHRQERAALFKVLTDRGEHAPWNIGMEELRQRVSVLQVSAPDTKPATTPATPATATQTPLPITQTPLPNKKKRGAKAPLSADALPTWMQGLIDLWHEILPELPGVVVINDDRKRAATDFRDWVLHSTRGDGSRRATNDTEMLAWAREFFTRARANDFIMGRGHRAPEHQNWRCSFEYLLSAKGMQKVIEQTQSEEAAQ